MKFKTFFLQRILAWALTILIGVTFIFFIPRMFPSDPVENMIAQMQSRSGNMDPAEMEALRQQLRIACHRTAGQSPAQLEESPLASYPQAK